MAKPRIFVSSTYYDLKHIRASLEAFITSFGYEPVLFENGDILFSHDKAVDESCYIEIENSHMQILIVGGHYGSAATSETITPDQKKDQYARFNSITRKEFEMALSREIPIFIFVDSGVLAEYNTYKKNRDNAEIVYANVDSVNIYLLLDEIYSLKQGNYVQGFTKFSDISEWLRSQWAHMLADFIKIRSKQIELETLNKSLNNLESIVNSLKEYTEAILNKVEPEKVEQIKSNEERHLKAQFNRFIESPLMNYLKEADFVTSDLSDGTFYNIFLKSTSAHKFLAEINTEWKYLTPDGMNKASQLFDALKSEFRS